MRPVTRILVTLLSLFLGLQAAWAQVSAGTTASPPDAQRVQCHSRMTRRAIRHGRNVVYMANHVEPQHGEKEKLPAHVYHLNYVKSADVESMIKPMLSSKGTIDASPGILVVRDDEQALKGVDRVVAKIDVRPIQVLVEAMIIQVTLKKDAWEAGVNLAAPTGQHNTHTLPALPETGPPAEWRQTLVA